MVKSGNSSKIEAYVESASERLLKKVPDEKGSAAVCQGLGNLYLSLEQLPPAEKWFRKLFEQQPTQFSPLVRVLAQQGRVAEALDICATADNPQSSAAALAAMAVLASGKATAADSQRAEQLISAALHRDDKDARFRLELGMLRAQLGQTDEAIGHFHAVVALDKRNVLALNNLATLLAERPAQRQEALKWIDQAIEISGSEPALFDTKATILILKGQPDQALDLLQAAIGVSDADPRFRFHLALAYRDLNDLPQAKNELQLALDKDLARQILTPTEQDLLAKLRLTLSL
jgi:tetratricopeptide (TPR) repeat protein